MEKTKEVIGDEHMTTSTLFVTETCANPKPNLISKTREEGELSSSDNDDDVIVIPPQTVSPAPETASTHVTHFSIGQNKNLQVVNTEGSFPRSNHENAVNFQSRSSSFSTHEKKFVQNMGPSHTSGRHLPIGSDHNLVISFSDDDSDSDSEEYIQENNPESKGNAVPDNRNSRQPVPLFAKSENLQQTTRSQVKPMPKKVPLSRPFLSAITKIKGVNGRGAGSSLFEQRSRVRNFTNPNKNLENRQRGCEEGVNLDDNKLQGLREQIAIREGELKLKSTQQSTGIVPGPYIDRARKSRVASAVPKEQENKRLKVNRPDSVQLNSVNLLALPAAKSKSVAKPPSSENSDSTKKTKFDSGQFNKMNPTSRVQSDNDRWKNQDDNLMDVSLGADFNSGYRRHDKSTGPENSDVVLNHQATPLTDMSSSGIIKKHGTIESKSHSKIHGHLSPSFQNSAACAHNSNYLRSNDCCKSASGDESLKVADGKLECPEDSSKKASLWNCLDNVNVSGTANTSLQSLLEIEDLQDGELEVAQEYRRRCEIEERNALKAYRKAQRALVEANVRCSNLYRERDVCSSRFHSFIMDDSNPLWFSKQNEHTGNRLNASQIIYDSNVDVAPKSIQDQPHYDVFSQMGCDPSICGVNRIPLGTAYRQTVGHNFVSDVNCEPDVSTSELEPHKGNRAANRVYSPYNDPNISADDDDNTPFSSEHETIQPCQESDEKEEVKDNAVKSCHINGTQDSLHLEAILRSKLFARLGMRSLLKTSSQNDDSIEPAVERGAENDPKIENFQTNMEGIPSSTTKKSQLSDFPGIDKPKENGKALSVCLNNLSTSRAITELEEFKESMQSKTSVSFSAPSILRTAFGCVKATSPSGLREIPSTTQENQTVNNLNQECIGVNSESIQPSSLLSSSVQETVGDLLVREISSYTCNLEIDLFLPLCMYELRGKCNNEECSWQHVKDPRSRKMNLPRHPHSPAQNLGQGCQKSFSAYLSVSSLLQRDPSIAGSFQYNTHGHIQTQGSWSRESLYFQNDVSNQSKQDPADYILSVERAILILNQEVNITEGVKKALSVISRALEVNPKPVVLWMVYLLIYKCNKSSVGKDEDMYFYAVKHNEGSYELWLLYINSRLLLHDRLLAYENALTALCCQAYTPDKDAVHTSACILDLFLQMMNCLCLSENFEKAIQRLYELLPSTTSNESRTMLLSDIYAVLTVSDKCIFWVCCVYLVIYGKLPDAVVQQFECEKEVFLDEWPSIEIEADKKQLAIKLMEKAMNSITLNIEPGSLQGETGLRSVHLFALSHIGCVLALDNLECSKNLLEKYIKLYPSCLELFLMAARLQENGFRDLSFDGFAEALNKWPKEFPGIHCIWNQYAQYALENGRVDVAKEVMLRWFQESRGLEALNGDSSPNKLDAMFEMLNLALYRLLQNDLIGARSASDGALKSAPREKYKHCVREHAVFLLTDSSHLQHDDPLTIILNVLKIYMFDARNLPGSEPLSRRFIQTIQKPRVRHLVNDMLEPISSDASLVNLVLEVWHGPSLLPSKLNKIKDLIDFIEGIMEITPSNYQLSLNVCTLLIKDFSSADIGSTSVLFWASLLLVSSIVQSVPVAPEYVFVEASIILRKITGIQGISETLHKKGLSVYPYSFKLWRSYLNLFKTIEDTKAVVEAARKRGVQLD